MSSDRFLNPYNFVRYLPEGKEIDKPEIKLLGRCVPPPHDRFIGITGRMECEVEAITPIFISDSELVEDRGNEHKSYRFFRLRNEKGEEEFALPSTSLRGMLRSVFEAATNSCFSIFEGGLLGKRERPENYDKTLFLTPGLIVEIPKSKDKPGFVMKMKYYKLPHNKFPQYKNNFKQNGEKILVKIKYLFNWDEVPRNDNERFIEFLEQRYGTGWVKTANIEKIDDGKTIRVSSEENNILLKLNDEKTKVNLKINDGRTDEFISKTENGKLNIYKINNDEVSEVKDYNENHKISEGYVVGYLKTSDIGLPGKTQKRNEYVFVEDSPSERFELSYEVYQNYIIANRNNKHEHTKIPKSGNTIWFRHEAKNIKEFGYAQIYRKPFGKSISDFLPQSFHPCSDYNSLCPSCRLFGWVHPQPPKDLKVKVAYAGRVKISHAQITENKGPLEDFPLAILSTPKPTTTFFYLLKNGKSDFNVSYDTIGAQLRGRKFYRHQKEAKEQEYVRTGKVEDHQNRTIRDALNSGTKFGFTIEFENLASVELGALLWSIEMENGMFHKLGLGKPLGFGSIKLLIKNINILNIKERYSSFANNRWITINDQKKAQWLSLFKGAMKNKYNKHFEELENIKDIKAIVSASALPVHYPRTSEKPEVEGKNFEWFMQNKRFGKTGKIPLKVAPEDTNGFPLEFKPNNRK